MRRFNFNVAKSVNEAEGRMLALNMEMLCKYFASVYKAKVKIQCVRGLGKVLKKPEEKLKGFGYGVPYVVEFTAGNESKSVVLETVRPGSFGHDYFSDRAQILLWQHSAFNKLPKHVRSVDVGAFTEKGNLKSVGDCTEFFIVTELTEGKPYFQDLDRIKNQKSITALDVDRCKALSDYIADVHGEKKDDPQIYVRQLRDLIGHGECIMGLIDSYPTGLSYIGEKDFVEIEKMSLDWRWKLKKRVHRCSRVHGDYHPWNVLFREGTDFTVIDRSRGEWGEPADDTSAMSINYVFYSLQTYGELAGPFQTLFDQFWKNYLDKTGDEEILTVIQPYCAWRCLVVASPLWYPNLSSDVRIKLFNFTKKVLKTKELDLKGINSYISP